MLTRAQLENLIKRIDEAESERPEPQPVLICP